MSNRSGQANRAHYLHSASFLSLGSMGDAARRDTPWHGAARRGTARRDAMRNGQRAQIRFLGPPPTGTTDAGPEQQATGPSAENHNSPSGDRFNRCHRRLLLISRDRSWPRFVRERAQVRAQLAGGPRTMRPAALGRPSGKNCCRAIVVIHLDCCPRAHLPDSLPNFTWARGAAIGRLAPPLTLAGPD